MVIKKLSAKASVETTLTYDPDALNRVAADERAVFEGNKAAKGSKQDAFRARVHAYGECVALLAPHQVVSPAGKVRKVAPVYTTTLQTQLVSAGVAAPTAKRLTERSAKYIVKVGCSTQATPDYFIEWVKKGGFESEAQIMRAIEPETDAPDWTKLAWAVAGKPNAKTGIPHGGLDDDDLSAFYAEVASIRVAKKIAEERASELSGKKTDVKAAFDAMLAAASERIAAARKAAPTV